MVPSATADLSPPGSETADVAGLAMPEVERELTTLAGHLEAGTCRYLVLLAAFDAGEGWQDGGLRSCAQWLSWRCGLSPTTAREQLRVARALTALPAVTSMFAAGRLSFSKVRALTRAATADTEADLVEIATSCTAAQLDRLCAGLLGARSQEQVLDQAARARFTASWQPDGSLKFSGHLAAEDGAVLMAALAAVRPERVVGEPPPADGGDRDAASRAARSDAAALVVLAGHALSQPPAEIGPAAVRLVIHTTADSLDEAAPRLLSAPERPGNASAEALHPAPGSASAMPFVSAYPADRAYAADTSDDVRSVAVLDAGPGIPTIRLGRTTFDRLTCQALIESVDGRSAAPQHRFANAPQRRALLRRDGGCVFPGCPRRRALHAHHLIPWSQGGPTTLENMGLICARHHLLVHEAGWVLRRDRVTTRWTATGPTGRVMQAGPAMAGSTDGVGRHHRSAIGEDHLAGTWNGEPLHLAYAVGVLT